MSIADGGAWSDRPELLNGTDRIPAQIEFFFPVCETAESRFLFGSLSSCISESEKARLQLNNAPNVIICIAACFYFPIGFPAEIQHYTESSDN